MSYYNIFRFIVAQQFIILTMTATTTETVLNTHTHSSAAMTIKCIL